jgi:hypothetical protein
MTDHESQHCPICEEAVTPVSRYPNYVCDSCIKKAVDCNGRPVLFGNTSLLGHGCQGKYRENNEEYHSNICYIEGVKCKAEEAYMGGIVIRPVE